MTASLFVLSNGRIAGISGMLGGLLTPVRGDVGWPIAFMGGMIIAPLSWALFTTVPTIEVKAGYPIIIVAGLLVGFGSRYGSGCTSGHGGNNHPDSQHPGQGRLCSPTDFCRIHSADKALNGERPSAATER